MESTGIFPRSLSPSYVTDGSQAMSNSTNHVVQIKDCPLNPRVFETIKTDSVLDFVLSSKSGLPRGANYIIIGDPGVGKTTTTMDLVSRIIKHNESVRCLYVHTEMTVIDVAQYTERFPSWAEIHMLFMNYGDDNGQSNWQRLNDVLNQGWEVVVIDSLAELLGIIKEEEGMSEKSAERMVLNLLSLHNQGKNEMGHNTTFLLVQQVTKDGKHLGSNRMKHATTAMVELKLVDLQHPTEGRYLVLTKNRRGSTGIKLYYSLNTHDEVFYDAERLAQDLRIAEIREESLLQKDNFNQSFNNFFKDGNTEK